MDSKKSEWVGYGLMSFGLVFLLVFFILLLQEAHWEFTVIAGVASLILLVFGLALAFAFTIIDRIKLPGIEIAFFQVERAPPKKLPVEVKREREEYAAQEAWPAA